jgi:hypothetical protein
MLPMFKFYDNLHSLEMMSDLRLGLLFFYTKNMELNLIREERNIMSRPLSKAELVQAMLVEYQKLDALLKTLTEDQMCLPEVCGLWSVKDILGHLYAWQQMVLSWYRAGVRGEDVKTPASDLKWSEIPLLNQRIYEQYRDVSLNELKARFAASHGEIFETLKSIPEEELITPKFYSWPKSTPLLSYFVSSTSSHYLWAYNEIRRWRKLQAKKLINER